VLRDSRSPAVQCLVGNPLQVLFREAFAYAQTATTKLEIRSKARPRRPVSFLRTEILI